MSHRMKLVSAISAFIVVLGLMIMGVFATNKATVNMGGTINFVADDVHATITGEITGTSNTAEELALNPLTYTATEEPLEDDLKTWQGKDLNFASKTSVITITITVENLSEERSLFVDLKGSVGTANNVTKALKYQDADYTSGTVKEIGVKGGENSNKATFKIEMSIDDKDVSFSGVDYTYDLNLYNEYVEVDKLSYSFDDTTKTASVKMVDAGITTGEIIIPKTITQNGQTYTVTTIPASAFEGCSGIKKITIPDTVTTVGDKAFNGCTGLGYTIYENGKYLGNENNPYHLLIGTETTNFTTFNINQNCKIVGYRVFGQNTSIQSINIPEGVVSVGDFCLAYCSNLTSVTIADSVKNLGNAVFGACSKLENVKLSAGLKSISKQLFIQCTGLKNIEIPDSVVNIETQAFQQCSKLESVKLSADLKSISSYAFAFTNLKNVEIPDDVQNIDFGAFGECISLESVSLSKNLKIIDQYAFMKCANLTGVQFPDGLTDIKYGAFGECKGLVDIVLPNSVQNLETGAFRLCTGLKSAKLPENLTVLNYGIFSECTSLESVILPPNLIEIGGMVFNQCNKLVLTELPNTVGKIGEYAFKNCKNIKLTELPDTVESIGRGAFQDCININFKLPSSLKEIGSAAFESCIGMTDITLPEGLEFIGDFAFNHCDHVANIKITIPKSMKQIGGQTYDPENPNNSVIGTHIFYNCGINALQEFEIDQSNANFVTIDGILYRKENGVPTVLIAYPTDKRDSTYVMPNTVVNAFELSMSRPFYLRKIVLSDAFVIKKLEGDQFRNKSWANTLSGMIYHYTGVTEVECNSEGLYMSDNGQVYSKDGTTLYYASIYSDVLVSDTEKTESLTFRQGVTTLSLGSIGGETNRDSNAISSNIDTNNRLKRYSEIVIPSSVTTIDDSTLASINAQSWKIIVEEGNASYQLDTNGKLVKVSA